MDEDVEETMTKLIDDVNSEENSTAAATTNKEKSRTVVNVNENLDGIDFSKGLPVNLTDLGLAVDQERFDMPDNVNASSPDPISEPVAGTSGENSSEVKKAVNHREIIENGILKNSADKKVDSTTEVVTLPDGKVEKASTELVVGDDNSDSSSVCEILDDDEEKMQEKINIPPKPAFSSIAEVLRAAQNNILLNSQSSTISQDEFYDNFVKFAKSRTDLSPDTRLVDIIRQYFEEQSKNRPLGFRKFTESNKITKPNLVTIPPSQVVDMIAEYEPTQPLASLCLGEPQQSALMSTEMAHKIQFAREPCPNFTRVLYDIGFSLTLESTYRNIIQKRSKDDAASSSKDSGASKIVDPAAITRLKKTHEELKQRNSHFKVKQYRCKMTGCTFFTDTLIQMSIHKQTPHRHGNRLVCAVCDDFRSADRADVADHYSEEHGMAAVFEEPPLRAPCPICDEDFPAKANLKLHIRECLLKNRNAKHMGSREQDKDVLNKWLWPRQRATYERAAPLIQNNQPNLKPMLPTVQPKLVRKSVADIVESVVGGQGRLAPRIIGASTSNFPTPRQAPGILSSGGPAYLVRNGQTYSLLSGQSSSGSQNLFMKAAQRPQPGQMLMNFNVCCEICDSIYDTKSVYVEHLREHHKKLLDKPNSELVGLAPLACSRCKERFYTYEGLERHLLMKHSLVTSDLLQRAHRKQDNGKCKLCGKVYAFNLLHHLVQDHKQNLCSAEILYSCDLCTFQCKSYVLLETHLRGTHSNGGVVDKRPFNTFQPSSASTPTPKVRAPINNAAKRYMPPAPAGPAPKMARFQTPNGVRYRSDAQVTADSRSGQPRKMAPAPEPAVKKTLRYCCTPCSLKFATYDEVIKHWSDKHLAKVLVKMCRVDSCEACKSKLVSHDGLLLDFVSYVSMEDDDLEIIDEKSNKKDSSEEIICLD